MENTRQDAPDKDNAAQPAQGDSTQPQQNGTAQPVNLMTELIDAQKKADEYLEALRRERAEFMNFRKRKEREGDEIYQNATVDTLKKILPVIDDLDRAIANVPAANAEDDVIKGFNLIHRKMLSLLDTAGIKVINPVGEAFNPAYHEALGQDEGTGVASGHVSSVLQKGYLHNDKVIRPALVRIAR